MKKQTIKHPAAKTPDSNANANANAKNRPFFLDTIFTNYRKYRNHKRYVHADLL